ncbi:MAG: hypothetical protein DRJ01_05940 [Bacteroidetes bacterium]|nr:MAG: hypothetical protein DRJ01_05940 [Bacteroidota bacterium]
MLSKVFISLFFPVLEHLSITFVLSVSAEYFGLTSSSYCTASTFLFLLTFCCFPSGPPSATSIKASPSPSPFLASIKASPSPSPFLASIKASPSPSPSSIARTTLNFDFTLSPTISKSTASSFVKVLSLPFVSAFLICDAILVTIFDPYLLDSSFFKESIR